MASSLTFRDGTRSDIAACLALDHSYETDFVWQMRIEDNPEQRQISFQRERLPRTLDAEWPKSEHRLQLALDKQQCFLVAQFSDDKEIVAYLSMRSDPVYHQARLQDLLVSRPYRRHKVGSGLLNIARNWARQHQLTRLVAELQTQNYPGIVFCQRSGFSFSGFNDQYFPNQDIAIFFSEALR